MVKWICESECPKILQNGLYDLYWLWAYGVEVRNYAWDTMAMHHCLDPAEDHDLSFLSSIYRPLHVFWKDESKDAEELLKYARTRDAVHVYNAKDCVATFEVWLRLKELLEVGGRMEFYERHYRAMFLPIFGLMKQGVRCDLQKQKEWAGELERRCDEIREALKGLAGEELYATKEGISFRGPSEEEWGELLIDPQGGTKPKNIDKEAAKRIGYVMSKELVKTRKNILLKDFSGKKLQRLFYETLKVPKQFKVTHTEEGKRYTETLDKTALTRIALRVPKAAEPARLLLEHRRKAKVAMFLKAKKDRDGRIRCMYKQNTEAGRLASAKNPMGGGFNLQNQDREIRNTYLPNEGQVWVALDGSQVEDRYCKMLTGAKRMQELANLRPDEFDAHTYMAKKLFPGREIDYKLRYMEKRVVHASQRGMRGKKLAEIFLREDEMIIAESECDRMIDTYLDEYWEIREQYFPWVREMLWTSGKRLANSWGRVVDFGTERMDEDLYRRAYSWLLQSECVDWLNQWGWLPAIEWCGKEGRKSRVLTQEHDGFGVSTEPEEAWDLVRCVVGNLERPRALRGGWLTVPVTVTVGRSWAGEKDGGVEFKRLPGREVFEASVKKCLS
jgi:DNA polymerase I-like protein with 3'-5' exonuclease and polymerase domains